MSNITNNVPKILMNTFQIEILHVATKKRYLIKSYWKYKTTTLANYKQNLSVQKNIRFCDMF